MEVLHDVNEMAQASQNLRRKAQASQDLTENAKSLQDLRENAQASPGLRVKSSQDLREKTHTVNLCLVTIKYKNPSWTSITVPQKYVLYFKE